MPVHLAHMVSCNFCLDLIGDDTKISDHVHRLFRFRPTHGNLSEDGETFAISPSDAFLCCIEHVVQTVVIFSLTD